jgi:hypothetical protein
LPSCATERCSTVAAADSAHENAILKNNDWCIPSPRCLASDVGVLDEIAAEIESCTAAIDSANALDSEVGDVLPYRAHQRKIRKVSRSANVYGGKRGVA